MFLLFMCSADDLRTPFTNYTSGYKALLDYVWIEPSTLEVRREPLLALVAFFSPGSGAECAVSFIHAWCTQLVTLLVCLTSLLLFVLVHGLPSAVSALQTKCCAIVHACAHITCALYRMEAVYQASIDFYKCHLLQVVGNVPIPSEEEIGSFIPSPAFPSDHLARLLAKASSEGRRSLLTATAQFWG
eukprot:1161343-Pelagomonas_calceolata.AAC.1